MRGVKTYFLDTSFLIDLMNGEEAALELHEEVKDREVTGTPCIYELSKFTQFDLEELFEGKEVIEFTTGDAETAGNIYYRLDEEGAGIGEMDIIIAGMVERRGLTLVTRDRDFEKFSGLDVEFY